MRESAVAHRACPWQHRGPLARNDQVIRQWHILRRLEGSTELTLQEFANGPPDDSFRHLRTLRRDLAALESAGLPLLTERLRMTLRAADTRLIGWILSFGRAVTVVRGLTQWERISGEARKSRSECDLICHGCRVG